MKTNILSRIFLPVAMLIFSLGLTTSCDSMIASTLEGTWEGDMYFTSYYDGRTYYSNYSEVEFIGDPFRLKSGSGYWIDYYSNAPWDYVANHMTWTVRDRVIYIHLVEDRYDFEVRDYHLDDYKFSGHVFYDGEERYFELRHTSSPNWNDYEYGYGYGYGYNSGYGRYYSPSRSTDNAADSTDGAAADGDAANLPARPVRHMRPAGMPVPFAAE